MQPAPLPRRMSSVMKNELIKAVLMVGLSLGLAQAQEGVTAIGGALSKDGLRVFPCERPWVAIPTFTWAPRSEKTKTPGRQASP
jgi:hypothetical protein